MIRCQVRTERVPDAPDTETHERMDVGDPHDRERHTTDDLALSGTALRKRPADRTRR